MVKKNLIFSILILYIFVSLCCFNIFQVSTNVKVDENQNDRNNTILGSPKSSAFDVSEKWNYTTEEDVEAVAVSADGNYMVIGTEYSGGSGEKNNTLFLKKTSTNETIWVYNTINDVNSVAISANGKYIVGGCDNPSHNAYNLFFFDNSIPVGDKQPLWSFNTSNDVNSVDISADGKYIIVGIAANPDELSILLFNNSVPVGEKRAVWTYLHIQNSILDVNSVAISSTGEYIVVGGDDELGDETLYLFNNSYASYTQFSSTKKPLWTYNTSEDINSVAISANGEYIAVGCDDGAYNVLLFNKSAEGIKQPEWKHQVLNYHVELVAISEGNGEYIVAGTYEAFPNGVGGSKLLLFNRSSYAGLPMWSFSRRVYSVAISADGEYIAAGDSSNVLLFNKSSEGIKQPEWSYGNNGLPILSVSMSAWGNYIGGGGVSTSGVAYMFYHARPIPRIISGGGGGDGDDDDDEETIPLGHSYLLFVAISIISLIIIMKRKINFSRN